MKLQLGQIDVYKEQIQNLKKQVQVCEEKIKFYDAENARRQSQLEEQLGISSTNETNLLKEIQRKDTIISDINKQLEEQTNIVHEKSEEVKNMNQENEQLRTQIRELNQSIQENEEEMKKIDEISMTQLNELKAAVLFIS